MNKHANGVLHSIVTKWDKNADYLSVYRALRIIFSYVQTNWDNDIGTSICHF